MNSENSKTSESHILLIKLADKLDLRNGKKIIALSSLSIYYTWKNYTIIINLKYQLPHEMMNFSYQANLILYQIYKIISNAFSKSTVKILINHQYKYMLTKPKIGSQLKLKKDIPLNY